MTEQIITFETAKLAKVKGFPIDVCLNSYNDHEKLSYNPCFVTRSFPAEYQHFHLANLEKHADKYAAPTQSLLQKWLREVHKLNVIVDVIDNSKYYHYDYCIVNHNKREYHDEDMMDQAYRFFKWHCNHVTYEDALEEGLVNALNLIEV